MTSIADIWLKLQTEIWEIRIVKNVTPFDALVLLTLIPSGTSILSKYSICNIQTLI